VSDFFGGQYESFRQMNIEKILSQLSPFNRLSKKWVYLKQTFYSSEKLSTSDFGMLIA